MHSFLIAFHLPKSTTSRETNLNMASLMHCITATFTILSILFQILALLPNPTESARLFEQCSRNKHCSSTTDNSYCGWSEFSDESTVCLCRDGFKSSFDGSTCIPIHQPCSIEGFNDPMTPGGGCPDLDRQFCRRNVCLCKPGYEYNQAGQCVPDQLMVMFLEQQQQQRNGSNTIQTVANPLVFRSEPRSFQSWEFEAKEIDLSRILMIMAAFMFVMLLVTVGSIIMAVIFFKKFNQLKVRQYEQIDQI